MSYFLPHKNETAVIDNRTRRTKHETASYNCSCTNESILFVSKISTRSRNMAIFILFHKMSNTKNINSFKLIEIDNVKAKTALYGWKQERFSFDWIRHSTNIQIRLYHKDHQFEITRFSNFLYASRYHSFFSPLKVSS